MLSLIIPVYNEADNLPHLRAAVADALGELRRPYEVIFVDDGSSDGSAELLQCFAASDPNIKVISFRRNFGQTAAMMAGIAHATGEIMVPLDADLQNDPHDIARLLAKLDEGYDVVSGWRKDRQDPWLSRTLPSAVANWLISSISGVHLHDYGCTLKAYRSSVLKGVRLYGEMHRFIPIYSAWQGGRICEIPVRHHPRRFGTSKYGARRIFKVVLDLLVVKFLSRYDTKPIYVFGFFGALFFLASLLSGIAAVILKLFFGVSFIQTPLPLLTVMGLILSVMTLLMGLLAELLVRVYYESQGKPTYLIRDTRNIGGS